MSIDWMLEPHLRQLFAHALIEFWSNHSVNTTFDRLISLTQWQRMLGRFTLPKALSVGNRLAEVSSVGEMYMAES